MLLQQREIAAAVAGLVLELPANLAGLLPSQAIDSGAS
jgi:hypothetical protein